MPIARQTSCWIPRAAEAEFLRLLSAQQAKILPLTGGGGIGKTSLLIWCFEHCQEKGIPALYLDLPRLTTSSALNMLLQLQTVHTPKFDQLRKALRGDERLADLLKSYGDSANTARELLQKEYGVDQEFGKYAGIAVGVWKVFSQLWQRKDKERHDQLLKQPEEHLLNALAKDFSKQGVMLLDTLEQAGKQKLQTRLLFHANGEINTRVEDTPQAETLLDYCAGMAGLLFQCPVVMVLAGRAPVRELKGRSFSDFAPTLSLPAFDTQEIQAYFQKALPHLPSAQTTDLAQLKTITCGNPLLLQRVAQLVSDWEGWAWQPKQWQPLLSAYQRDPKHGLLLYVTELLADHIQPDDRAFWRLALTRQFIQHDIASILFPTSEFGTQSGMTRLEAYAEKGIIFSGRGENLDKYYLHDETRAALQAWAEREKCWLDANAEQIHAQLGVWFDQQSGWPNAFTDPEETSPENDNPLCLEAAYHAFMSDAEFERREKGREKGEFWQALAGSLYRTNVWKRQRVTLLLQEESHETIALLQVDREQSATRLQSKTSDYLTRKAIQGRLPSNWRENINTLCESLQENPEDSELWRLLAEIESLAVDKRDGYYRQAIQLAPNNADNIGLFARFIYDQQDYNQAEDLYRQAIEVDPSHARNLGNFAVLMHFERKDYDQAEILYQRALAVDSNHVDNLGNLATLMHFIRKDYDQAEIFYQRALAADSHDAHWLGRFAFFMESIRKDYDQAEIFYQRALAAESNLAYNFCFFAEFMHDIRKDYDQAESLYRQAIEVDPNDAYSLGNLALFMKTIRKDYDQAESLYLQAIEADPNNARNIFRFAIFMESIRRDYDQAESLYRRAAEADPNNADVLGNFAVFMSEIRKDYDQAERLYQLAETLYQRAITADSSHVHNLCNFAAFMHDIRKDYDLAESLLQRAIAADPNHANSLGNFAIFLHLHRKDHAQAQTLYLRALELNPSDANLMGNLSQLYLQAGDVVQGRAWVDKAFATPSDNQALHLELWLYRYAHFPAEYPQAVAEIQALLDSGARSVGWDFSGNLAQVRDTHPDFAQLQALVTAINTSV